MRSRMVATARAARRLAVLAAAMVGLFALTIAPAHAGVVVYQGDDYASVGVGGFSGVTFDVVDVCDRERDGHGVYVKVVLNDGYDQFGDANGSAAPCSTRNYTRYRVSYIYVCESVAGPDLCSGRGYP